MLLQCGLLYSFHLTLLDQHQTTAEHYKECFYAVWSTKFKEYFAVWSTKDILQCGAQRKPNDKVLLHFFSCSPCNRWRKWSPLEQTSNTVENGHLGEIHIKWMDGWYQVMKIKIKSTHPPLLLYDTLVTGMVSSIPPWPLGSSLGPWKVAPSWLFRSLVGN